MTLEKPHRRVVDGHGVLGHHPAHRRHRRRPRGATGPGRSFWDTKISNRTITPVAMATSNVHFADYPMALELQYGRARVFNSTMGHDVKALKVPGTAELIRRGTAWAAGVLN